MRADTPQAPRRKRVTVFIDGSNFYHALRARFSRASVDFGRLVSALVGPDRELIRVYYYNAPVNVVEVPDQYRKQQRFFSGLRRLDDFELKRTAISFTSRRCALSAPTQRSPSPPKRRPSYLEPVSSTIPRRSQCSKTSSTTSAEG